MNTDVMRPIRHRAWLLPLAVLLSGALLLAAWLRVAAAPGQANPGPAAHSLTQFGKGEAAWDTPAGAGLLESLAGSLAAASLQTTTTPVLLAPTAPFDLRIVKSQIPQIFTVGANNRYIINVSRTNTETVSAAVIIEDILPAGMSWKPPTTASSTWDCTTSNATTVSCVYVGAIGATVVSLEPINVNVTVTSGIEPVVTNSARILTVDGDATNNAYTVTTTIDSVDLQIQKTVSSLNVTPGTPVTYTLVIRNEGPSLAQNVVVTDTLNVSVTYTSPNPEWSQTSPTLGRWDIPTLAKGASRTLTLVATPDTRLNGQVSNTARVFSSNRSDWNLSNNVATAYFFVGGMQISKSVSPTTPVSAGDLINYTVVIHNAGTAAVNGVFVRDVLSTCLTYVDGSSSLGITPSYNTSDRTVTLYQSSLAGGGSTTLWINARPNNTVTSGKTITNTASVSWGSPLITIYSNEVSTDASPGAALQIGKSDGLTQVNPGQYISYTVTITNVGSLATQINTLVVTDTFVSNLTYEALDKKGLDMTALRAGTNYQTWSINNKSLAPGDKISFEIGARVPSNASTASGSFAINRVLAFARDINTKPISSVSPDDQDEITSTPIYSLKIGKSVKPTQAKVGESFTFKIEVVNNGSTTINSIVVEDEFTADLDLTSATTTRGTATLNTGTREVVVSIPTLNAGETTSIVIVAKVNSSVTAAKTLRNRAQMSWPTNNTLRTSAVAFRVLPSSTLPGTGRAASPPGKTQFHPGMATRAGAATGINLAWLIGGAAVALILLALVLLCAGLLLYLRRPLYAGAVTRAGLLLFVVGLFGVAAAWMARPAARPEGQIAALQGAKPARATTIPRLPTATPLPPTPTLPAGVIVSQAQPEIEHLLPTPTPEVLPDYPIPTPTIGTTEGPDGGPPDSSAITRLIIPSMGLDTEVKYVPYNGDTWLIGGLKQEIAWMGDTSWPGLGGNTGLAGHVDLADGSAGPFWNLKNLKPGDQVIVYTESKVYTYQVREQTVVDDTDLSVVAPTDSPQVTLITCTGWDAELYAYMKRLIVYADLKSVKTAQE